MGSTTIVRGVVHYTANEMLLLSETAAQESPIGNDIEPRRRGSLTKKESHSPSSIRKERGSVRYVTGSWSLEMLHQTISYQ